MVNAYRSQVNPEKCKKIFIKNDPMTLNVGRVLISRSSYLTKPVESGKKNIVKN